MNVLAEDGGAWRAEFKERVRPFSRRWRRARLVGRALATLWVPLLVAAALLAVLRFTLLDLPGDTAVFWLLPPLWGLFLALSYLLDRPRLDRLARAIDAQLGLDERLGSAVALIGAQPREEQAARLIRRLRLDALNLLEERGGDAARSFKPRVRHRRAPLVAALIFLAVGGLLLALPGPAAAGRAERQAIRAAALDQATRLAQVRRETVPRPELPDATRTVLDAQLGAAETALRQHPADRAANVAALSQAEERLRTLLPDNANALSVARRGAARDIQTALSALLDSPPQGASELERAASATEMAIEQLAQQAPGSRTSQLAVAGSLDRIARGLDSTDKDLAAVLRKTAAALRADRNTPSNTLKEMADKLRETARAQAGLDLLTNAVSQVDDSKGQVAQAGLPPAGSAAAAANRPLGRLAQAPPGAAPPAGAQAGGDTAAGGTSGAAGSTGSASSAGRPGAGSDGQGGGNPSANNAPGDARLSGNVQGGGGTRNGTAGQSGTGAGRAGAGSSGSLQPTAPEESVYVPSGVVPEVKTGGPQDRVAGVQSPGGGGNGQETIVRSDGGYNPGVKTPYSRVIGQYKDAAAQALDHTYIPADAKQYVRDYFTSISPDSNAAGP